MDEHLPGADTNNQPSAFLTPGRRGHKWIVGAVIVFVFLLAIYITYGSQQTKVSRLNQQVISLKTELNALKHTDTTGQSGSINISVGKSPILGDIEIKARDSERNSDIASLQTQMEAFFSQNGYYPSRTSMNSPAWLSSNMKSLDVTSLTDPSNPTSSTTLVSTPTANFYAYAVSDSSGSSCEADQNKCAKYTLTATYEGTVNGAKTYAKHNLD
jgi:hypothetical protein